MLYIYGFFYQPINGTEFEKLVGFEWFVLAISLVLFYLILFKWKQHDLWNLIIQNTALIVISFPFYVSVLELIGIGLDDTIQSFNPFFLIMMLTVFTIYLNDWKKLKKPELDNIISTLNHFIKEPFAFKYI